MIVTQNEKMNVVVAGGPNGVGFCRGTLPGDDVYVAVNTDQGLPDLTFHTHPPPGCDVAHVWRAGADWFMEDFGRGGAVGAASRTAGERVHPETIRQWGNVRWMLIPEDRLFIRCGTILAVASCVHTINYASYHCGAPIVDDLVCHNFGRVRSEPTQLILRVSGYTDPCPVTIPALEPGESQPVASPFFRFHVMALHSQVKPMPTQLTVEVEGRVCPEATRELWVSGIWSWSYDREARRTLAAFVSPYDPTIQRAVDAAEVRLRTKTGLASFRDLVASRREDRVTTPFQGLYDYLRETGRLCWCAPEGGHDYQRIRPPHEILDFASGPGTGKATCIDLCLLLASCLESVGLCPLVILIAGADGVPRHALAGCWRGSSPGGTPEIEDGKSIREDVRAEDIFVVEATGVADTGPGQPGGLTFAQAHSSAQKQVEQAPWLCAVDIMALHGRDGGITPINCPRQEAVSLAYLEAERLALRKKRSLIQTNFLFYGCLKANGELIRSWSRETGMDTERVCEEIDRSTSVKQVSGALAVSGIYADCQRLAELVAWRNRSPCVREQDLLWALATRGRSSASLLRVCSELGISLLSLEEHLRRSCRWFGMPTSFTSFASSLGG